MKKIRKKPAAQSRGCLLVSPLRGSPEPHIARTNPGFRVWGGSLRKESLPPFVARKNTPQSGPKMKCCVPEGRKHPTPSGTGTEPDAPHAIGPVPAPGTHQFSQVLLAIGPPVRTDPRKNRERNDPLADLFSLILVSCQLLVYPAYAESGTHCMTCSPRSHVQHIT